MILIHFTTTIINLLLNETNKYYNINKINSCLQNL